MSYVVRSALRGLRSALGGIMSCALGLLTACDDVDLPEARRIESLRVLGVRAEPPTLLPGTSTRLSLSCADGRGGPSGDPSCTADVAWFDGCDNPDGNDPETCLDRFRSWGDRLMDPISETPTSAFPQGFGTGSRFELRPRERVLVGETPIGGERVAYGTSYVFFAACAGTLVPVPNVSGRLPVECRDGRQGQLLDARSMVVGFTAVYSYDRVTSLNPELSSVSFDGTELPPSCGSSDDCPSGFECTLTQRCAAVVAPCQPNEDCPEHCVRVTLSPDSFRLFAASGTKMSGTLKSLWVSYYTNAGELPAEEASFGLRPPESELKRQPSECIRWMAPGTPTEHARLWAVVRDNRGGLAVWEQPIVVRSTRKN